MNGYIIVAYNTNLEPTYISNTSPILWTNNINESKKFLSFRLAKSELDDNFISLSAVISYTDINSIYISEYKNGIEINREVYLCA